MVDPVYQSFDYQKYPILPSKFTIPQLSRHHVHRKRLIQFLNNHMEKRIILVSAPAGFGKTTLLAEWSHQVTSPIDWLSLDDLDNDHNRFLSNLLHALNKHLKPAGPTPIFYEVTLYTITYKIST